MLGNDAARSCRPMASKSVTNQRLFRSGAPSRNKAIDLWDTKVLPASRRYVFTVAPGTAIGAPTLVRRKVGWRKGIGIFQRGSAGPALENPDALSPTNR